ncbi:MAG: hypothetical protein G01um101419_774 [Parcubacteria group bacterium Gr01-1014_19]|nr:MAG: hypothetical protein G01um101419_774 [Parcubacteria group bacterium Gr01-1014_19]
MTLDDKQVKKVCGLGNKEKTCSFLMMSADGFECAKKTAIEAVINQRRDAGTMNAKGDNCSGPPNFAMGED